MTQNFEEFINKTETPDFLEFVQMCRSISPVVLIAGSVYLADSFTPASEYVFFHTLKGVKITDNFLDVIKTGGVKNMDSINTYISKSPTLNIAFSNHFAYKFFT